MEKYRHNTRQLASDLPYLNVAIPDPELEALEIRCEDCGWREHLGAADTADEVTAEVAVAA